MAKVSCTTRLLPEIFLNNPIVKMHHVILTGGSAPVSEQRKLATLGNGPLEQVGPELQMALVQA